MKLLSGKSFAVEPKTLQRALEVLLERKEGITRGALAQYLRVSPMTAGKIAERLLDVGVLTEIAEASGVSITLEEAALPMTAAVKSFCGLLGLSPLYVGNEGKLIAILPAEEADRALEIVRACPYGENAAIIGKVDAGKGVMLVTPLGGKRKIGPLVGEGLPRIC